MIYIIKLICLFIYLFYKVKIIIRHISYIYLLILYLNVLISIITLSFFYYSCCYSHNPIVSCFISHFSYYQHYQLYQLYQHFMSFISSIPPSPNSPSQSTSPNLNSTPPKQCYQHIIQAPSSLNVQPLPSHAFSSHISPHKSALTHMVYQAETKTPFPV